MSVALWFVADFYSQLYDNCIGGLRKVPLLSLPSLSARTGSTLYLLSLN
jgi:hypothetical protein